MKNLLKLMFAASASIALLASCSKDDPITPPDPDPETPVLVELKLETAALTTRAIDEDSIADINVYFYSKKNSGDYHFFTTDFTKLTFEILPGDYKLYVITNESTDLGAMTESKLLQTELQIGNMTNYIPMVGSMDVNILAATTLPTLTVKRVAAKITYSVSIDDAVASDIKLRSIQFMTVPNSTLLFGTGSKSTDKNDFFNDAIIETKNEKVYSGVYYMLENCQGTIASITQPTEKAPENAPACATYMHILAENAGKLISYTVYLGENSTSNFDVRRNTNHNMNLVIKGENEIDNRVVVYEGIYYGQANCYLVGTTQTSCVVDITPYLTNSEFEPTGVKAPNAPKIASAAVVWSEKSNLPTLSLDASNNKLTVSNISTGNSLIAIKDNVGNILWSFHIWKPEIDATKLLTYTAPEPYTSNFLEPIDVMPLALGAMNTTTATGTEAQKVKTCGFYYQWGRKDPLGRLASLSTPSLLQTYPSISWLTDKASFYDVTSSEAIAFSIAHPTTFITKITWYIDKSLNLWNSQKKTVFDPCPSGYRVAPVRFMYNFFKKSDVTAPNAKGSYNLGYDFYYQNQGSGNTDFYPSSGLRNDSGELMHTCGISRWNWGFLWSSSHGSGDPSSGNFRGDYISVVLSNSSSGYGCLVRCTRDN